MSRIGFSQTQILVYQIQRLANVLISFVMRLSWGALMRVNEALNFTPQMGTTYLSAFYMGYTIMRYCRVVF